jgi:hypothetical protein
MRSRIPTVTFTAMIECRVTGRHQLASGGICRDLAGPSGEELPRPRFSDSLPLSYLEFG